MYICPSNWNSQIYKTKSTISLLPPVPFSEPMGLVLAMEPSEATETLIPSSATSALSASANALTACCEAAKAEHSGNDIFPSELDTNIM